MESRLVFNKPGSGFHKKYTAVCVCSNLRHSQRKLQRLTMTNVLSVRWLCQVNLYHHYKQLWMSWIYVFGQWCLMGCHSLPRQNYYPTCFSTSFSSIFFSFHTAHSVISDSSLRWLCSSAEWGCMLFIYNLFVFHLVLSDTFAVA